MLFRQIMVLAVVIKGAEVDVGSGVRRLHLQDALIALDGFGVRCRIIFQADATREQLADRFRRWQLAYLGCRAGRDHALLGREIHHVLACDWLDRCPSMTEGDAPGAH